MIEPDGSVRPEPFLDVRDRLQTENYEQGLLGLAFHPDFIDNGRFFIDYTRQPDGATVVSELHAAGGLADAARERVLLVIGQRGGAHNGGALSFDPSGRLLIAVGDGGFGGYEQGQSQDPAVPLGKLLRLDIDRPGAPDFAARLADGSVETVASGLRNPWRFSVDPELGHIYIGDAGRRDWEEIDVIRAGTTGLDFGWSQVEGPQCTELHPACDISAFEPPALTYAHEEGIAVVGGYAYYGSQPELMGSYVFGDLLGDIFAVPLDDLLSGGAAHVAIGGLDAPGLLWSFGEDADGELMVVSGDGRILRLVASAR